MSFFRKRTDLPTSPDQYRTYVVVDRLETVAARMEQLATDIEEALRQREEKRHV